LSSLTAITGIKKEPGAGSRDPKDYIVPEEEFILSFFRSYFLVAFMAPRAPEPLYPSRGQPGDGNGINGTGRKEERQERRNKSSGTSLRVSL
jgi:hypothetical protein